MRTFLLIRILIAGLVGVCWLTPACRAENVPGGKGVNVMTRYMMIFSELENNLLVAQNSANQQQLKALLSPFFEFNGSAHQRLTLDAYLKQASDNISWQISSIRVYEVGANAIVYFTLSANGQPDKTIVDVWEQNQQMWLLRVRFESR